MQGLLRGQFQFQAFRRDAGLGRHQGHRGHDLADGLVAEFHHGLNQPAVILFDKAFFFTGGDEGFDVLGGSCGFGLFGFGIYDFEQRMSEGEDCHADCGKGDGGGSDNA